MRLGASSVAPPKKTDTAFVFTKAAPKGRNVQSSADKNAKSPGFLNKKA